MKEKGDAAYEEWYDGHKEACTINHTGSSGMMEVEAARVMWERSLEHGLRYTTLVSDGDSKTYSELCSMNPYDVPISKEECTNHVSKRLGTALRNLVSTEAKKKKNTLGGKKIGNLTQVKINLLQHHYKSAVASKAPSVEELRKRIWRAFLHSSSTDENPQHDCCPVGPTSACFWQRAISRNEEPPSHRGKSSSFINSNVALHIKPIYERLTSDELLSRCLKGMTQNANESLHAVIWAKCPKHLFVGRKRIEIATSLAIGQFNLGSHSLHMFLQTCGLSSQQSSLQRGIKRDKGRISKAEKCEDIEVKRRRTQIVQATIAAVEENTRREGVVYSSGGF